MLRNRRYFLIASALASSVIMIADVSRALTQSEESVSPWRVENLDSIEDPTLDDLLLNSITEEELIRIGISSELAKTIVEHREIYGSFKSIDDISTLEGVDYENITRIVRYMEESQLKNGWSVRYLSRIQGDNPTPKEVGESPIRFSQKWEAQSPTGVSLKLSTDKDAGERHLWDHSVFSLEVPISGHDGKVVIGDYLIGCSQGLVIRTSHNYGLSKNPETNLHFYPDGLQSSNSWDEDILLRGAGIQYTHKSVSSLAWFSIRNRDAYLDSSGNITSFSTTGLHRTVTEIDHQDACREEVWGASVRFSGITPGLALSSTIARVHWNRMVVFNGDLRENALCGSASLEFRADILDFSMEAAFDESGNTAQMATFNLQTDPIKTALALYRVAPNYFSPLASSLDFSQGRVRNREGLYSHLLVPISRGSFSCFAHLYRFPQRLPGDSWGGQDYCFSIHRRFFKESIADLSSRWVQEDEPETLNRTDRWRGTASWRMKTFQKCWINPKIQLCRDVNFPEIGRLFSLKMDNCLIDSKKVRLNSAISAGIYRADDYAVRLYWFESDPGNILRVKPLWGEGSLLQTSMEISNNRMGRLFLKISWDQPAASSGRLPARWITAMFLYP